MPPWAVHGPAAPSLPPVLNLSLQNNLCRVPPLAIGSPSTGCDKFCMEKFVVRVYPLRSTDPTTTPDTCPYRIAARRGSRNALGHFFPAPSVNPVNESRGHYDLRGFCYTPRTDFLALSWDAA